MQYIIKSKLIAEKIKEKEMKKCEVAKRCGISGSTLNRILEAKKKVRRIDISRLAEFLGIDKNELCEK